MHMLSLPFALALTNTRSFEPPAIALSSLVSGNAAAALAEALGGDGIVQVIGIPGYASLRLAVLTHARECDGFVQPHEFADGTVRTSIASRTVPGPGGRQPFELPDTAPCALLAKALDPFRAVVDDATRTFSASLSSLIGVDAPLLSTPDGAHDFATFSDVVASGDHLEHLHKYDARVRAAKTASAGEPTLELHTDQGIFIAFAPALETSQSAFLVQRASGERAAAVFRDDALVFMLGHGAEAILHLKVSPHLYGGTTPCCTPAHLEALRAPAQ